MLRLRQQWRKLFWKYIAGYFGLAVPGTTVFVLMGASMWASRPYTVGHVLGVAFGLACWAGAIWCVLSATLRVVRWDCPACGKRLDTKIAWICGRCDRENNSYIYTILSKCWHCKGRPSGHVCHHCGVPTWFFKGGDDGLRHPARRVPDPLAGETVEQARARREQEIAERRHEIERLKHEAEIRNLTAQAERIRNPPSPADGDAMLEQQLERALNRLKVGMRAVAKSKQLQAQVDQEIAANAPGLPADEVTRLRDYARRQFDAYREDITLGRYDQ